MITMTKRRAPLLMIAASGLLTAALAVTPLMFAQSSTLEAVPAAPLAGGVEIASGTTSTEASAVAERSDQVSRALERPSLEQIASDRVAAQAQTVAAISVQGERLSVAEKQAAEKKAAEKAQQEAAAKAAAAGAKKAAGSGGYSGSPREIARQMAAKDYGWGEQQFQCYDNIIMRESEWVITATNPSSGAYGIPQALPASKLATAGSDWRTNPATQIRWGLDYVKGRYGTPCAAWSFKSVKGWY